MRFYNTFGRQVEDFKPISGDSVKLYCCGPTVYDYAQIGNLRAFVFDDTLRRALAVNGYEVQQVMNITDVGHLASDEDEGEDKLERGAQRDQKTVWEVADFYIEAFLRDANALNILPPNGYHGPHQPYARATDFIKPQIELVGSLLSKGFAYQTEQAIYFDVAKLNDYGKLSGQKLSDKEVAARADVVTDSAKHHPQDFAVWFFKVGRFASHSMSWDSPWGEGFPGWHLECSAIIHATLGEPIDIHTGGVDHIGTHHTNEIAQTEAGYGSKLANFWLHNEHLLVDGQKMSKSKANFYTLADVKAKGFEPLALRLLFLQSHYRTQTNFTWGSLAAAQKNLASLRAMADWRYQANSKAEPIGGDYFSQRQTELKTALANDLATPKALASLEAIADHLVINGVHTDDSQAFISFLGFLDEAFGLDLLTSSDINDDQKQLISQRQAARASQDWSRSDQLRRDLQKQGLDISDTDLGPIWQRI